MFAFLHTVMQVCTGEAIITITVLYCFLESVHVLVACTNKILKAIRGDRLENLNSRWKGTAEGKHVLGLKFTESMGGGR